jgi:hypothetical protein
MRSSDGILSKGLTSPPPPAKAAESPPLLAEARQICYFVLEICRQLRENKFVGGEIGKINKINNVLWW